MLILPPSQRSFVFRWFEGNSVRCICNGPNAVHCNFASQFCRSLVFLGLCLLVCPITDFNFFQGILPAVISSLQ